MGGRGSGGRNKKSAANRAVLGDPGKHKKQQPAAREAAPPPITGAPAKPPFLKGRAAELWDAYLPELARLGVLTSLDAHTFACWCALAAEFEKSPKRMTSSRISQMRLLASSIGLDPRSRSGIDAFTSGQRTPQHVTPREKPKPANATDKYFTVQ